jgi:hypothetical protein
MYARIDDNGSIIEFPVRDFDTLRLPSSDPIPDDIVEVDTETNKPSKSWNQILSYNGVENINGNYFLNYSVNERHNDFDSKKSFIEKLVKQYKNQNERKFVALSKQINESYKQDEINTWNLQVTEAKNYLNNINDHSFIAKLSQERGIDLSDFVNKIITKHNSYVEEYGSILGKYQKNRELLSSIDLTDESTFDLIDQYGW